jgi:hypothetical protein
MSLDSLQLAIPLILIFFVGYWQAALIGSKTTIEKIGLAYLLGTFWTTVVTFLIHVCFAIEYSFILVICELCASFLIFGLLQKFEIPNISIASLRKYYKESTGIEKFLVLILLVFCVHTVIQNSIWPISDWDSLALYDFRARVMVATGSYNQGYELGYFFQYPPYTSLLHTISYLFNSENAKIWYSLIFSSLVLLFYYLLTQKVSRFYALSGTVLMSLSPYILEHSMVAYTNLSFTTYLVLSFIYLWQWVEYKNRYHLVLGALLLAASSWIRLSEPFWILGLLVIVFGMIKNRLHVFTALGSIALVLVMRSFWPKLVTYIARASIPAVNSVGYGTVANVAAATPLLTTILSYLGVLGNLSLVLQQTPAELTAKILFINQYIYIYIIKLLQYLLLPWCITVLIDLKNNFKEKVLIETGTLLCVFALIWAGTYIFSFTFETWDQIGGSASRMSMFISPLIVYTIMTSSIWQTISNKKKKP